MSLSPVYPRETTLVLEKCRATALYHQQVLGFTTTLLSSDHTTKTFNLGTWLVGWFIAQIASLYVTESGTGYPLFITLKEATTWIRALNLPMYIQR